MGMDSALTGGLSAQAMINAAGTGIKALYIAGEDVIAKANGDADYVRQQLGKLDFLIVQEMHLTETAKAADVVFPVVTFAETQGTQVNNGSQVQLVRRSIPPVGQARPDWMVINSIAKLMGVDFGYQGAVKNIFREIAEKVPGYSGMTHNRLANEGALDVVRAQPDLKSMSRADLNERLASEVARINRNIPVDTDAQPIKAGRRLHSRYPLVTRYSETLPPTFPQIESEEKAEVVVFPA